MSDETKGLAIDRAFASPPISVPQQTIAHARIVSHVGDYYPWFDWLRAICAVAVVWSHSGVFAWSNAGNFAVQVFFALSGWLIGGILLNTTARELPRFFFNRSIRIWAPYYLAVALLLLVSIARDPITSKWIEFVIYKLTFVWNIFGVPQLEQFRNAMPQKGTLNHIWSVNAEEQFYLISPIILVLGANRGGRAVTTWVAIAALALIFDSMYASIVLGVLAAVAVRRLGPIHERSVTRAGLVVVLLLATFGLTTELDYFRVAPVAAICIVLLLAIKGKKTLAGEAAGGLSYPLYLNQWIGGYIVNLALKGFPFWFRVSVDTVIGVIIALSLYWFFERRLLAKRSKWYTENRGKAWTACAYTMVAAGIIYGTIMR